jgi:hypothetical protein
MAAGEWAVAIQVAIRVTTWGGPYMGRGSETPVNTILSPKPPVVQISAHEVAASGGLYEMEDVKVGPITPDYVSGGGGGYTPAQLAPEGDELVEVEYILTGDIDGTYSRIRLDTTDPTAYYLYLRNTARTPRRVP